MFHSRLCLLHEGAATRELSPVLAPNHNGDATEPTQQSLGTNETWPEAAESGGTFWRFWHRRLSGMPTLCLPVVCSLPARRLLVTVRILNEMRLDYSSIHAGFAYKTTEQLRHSRALLRCIVCSRDDAFLAPAERSFRFGVSAVARNCVRGLRRLLRRKAGAVRTAVVWLGAGMYTAIV